jgi:hypothetical protein
MRNHDYLISAAVICMSLVGASLQGEEGGRRPPNQEELPGVWVGLEDKGVGYSRLVLLPDGTGLIAEYDVRFPFLAWKIKSWKVSGGRLELELDPVTKDTHKIRASGRVECHIESEMIILMTEVPILPDSRRTVILRREGTQARILEDLRKSMEKIAKRLTNGPSGVTPKAASPHP